jgi:hypothetical protein
MVEKNGETKVSIALEKTEPNGILKILYLYHVNISVTNDSVHFIKKKDEHEKYQY